MIRVVVVLFFEGVLIFICYEIFDVLRVVDGIVVFKYIEVKRYDVVVIKMFL